VEITLYNQCLAKGVLATRWLEDLIASEQMEGVILTSLKIKVYVLAHLVTGTSQLCIIAVFN
jgi:hypothetical protein